MIDSGPRRLTAWRAVGQSAAGLGVALLLLEALLQVIAAMAWARGRESATGPAPEGERVVLCEGDCFTYGLGSSSAEQSYPSQPERRGAQAVLVGCPRADPVVDRAAQRAASEAGSEWLSISEELDRLLRSTAQDDLFIPDGHCTDRGYGVIARRVAEDARRRLP